MVGGELGHRGVVPTHVTVQVNDINIVVEVWSAPESSLPAAVLIPGTGALADDWTIVAEALSRSRTVYAVNVRGHGRSDWPGEYSIGLMAADLCQLLRSLAGDTFSLIGHSLGGLVAALVASQDPHLVHRLVLEDVGLPRPRPATRPERPPGALSFDWRVVEQVRPEIDDPDPQWDRILAGVSAPTLIVAGGPSSFVPDEHVTELLGLLPDGRLVTLDTGHLVHATKPHEFIDCVQGFLD